MVKKVLITLAPGQVISVITEMANRDIITLLIFVERVSDESKMLLTPGLTALAPIFFFTTGLPSDRTA
jgi:hypothetical protein